MNALGIPLIDCDIHQNEPDAETLYACIEEPYQREIRKQGPRPMGSGIRFEDGGLRRELIQDDGKHGGNHYPILKKELLDRYGHRFGLLSSSTHATSGQPDPDYAMALARAYNKMTADHWLPQDDRLMMAVTAAAQDPVASAREIEAWAGHPQVKAVAMAATAGRTPLGHRWFWPLFEACEKHGLPLHLHPSTTAVIANHASMASGMATNYLQSHCALPQFYQSDLISLVLEGTFERFPGLKVMMIEGGVTWLAHLLWRMDKEFKGLRHQAPLLKRLPSDYVRDHIVLGSQPLEEPDRPRQLVQLFDMIGADDLVVYCSDFPHFDFDPPDVLRAFPEESLKKILHDNAARLFGLPTLEELEAESATPEVESAGQA
ncbi:MAG: amidohydrolase family protein [Opitutales bacterium]